MIPPTTTYVSLRDPSVQLGAKDPIFKQQAGLPKFLGDSATVQRQK